nr:glycoside hydrolase family 2 TIM barrel-domain containing protein [Nakamurella aerolata]
MISAQTRNYLESTEPYRGELAAPRSWLHSDAPRIDATGQWEFRLLPQAEPPDEAVDAFAANDYDGGDGWGSIEVPGHWVLNGGADRNSPYGAPIYTNVQYPFPIDPPHVPDANPTGDYRRSVDVPAEFADAERLLLRFDGVESTFKVWVNGQEIGSASGSRLAHEFDVTAAVKPGQPNVIAVRVHQWSAASYLEDQDQWWLPGIFREVTLLARPAGGIDDVWLRTGYDGAVMGPGRGTLDPEISAGAAAFPVRLQIEELGVDVTWTEPAEVKPLALDGVYPWSADSPRLYTAVISGAAERIEQRIGFRTVQIVGDQLLVNGRKVVLHGVNRHEIQAERGRVFAEDGPTGARADLALMKQHNVNAIRTSHYPPHPRLLDLADELGFWVIDECDLETHGFFYNNWVDNPSDDPRWRAAYLDRIRRTVERDKNHPSVIIWSLGNESHTGQNLAAMSAWVHQRDAGRPVHYEGDYRGEYTDVYSRMYATIGEVTSIGSDHDHRPLLHCSIAEGARQRSKPFLQCEYVHAMGNGPGAIDRYEALVDEYPRVHGGFVWEWRDHGLATTAADGTPFYAYGGDFGEVVHDGNFVMDGMIFSDGTPSPGLKEWATVVAPIRFTLDPAAGTVAVQNLRHSADTADLVIRWRLERDGEPVADGVLDVAPVAPGKTETVALPVSATAVEPATDTGSAPGGEYWLTVSAELAADTAWGSAGHELAFSQAQLAADASPAPARAVGVTAAEFAAPLTPATATVPRRLLLGPAVFDGGALVELAGAPAAGPLPELWRAPTDNDRGQSFASNDTVDPYSELRNEFDRPERPDPLSVRWRAAGLHRLQHRVLAQQSGEGWLRTELVSMPATSARQLHSTVLWRLRGDGTLALSVDLTPGTGWDLIWPRLGVRFDLPGDVDRVSWFGRGPGEAYPDSLRASRIGRFSSSVDELAAPYSRPQETGHRPEFRRLELLRGNGSVLALESVPDASGARPGFTVSGWTAQQLAQADHPHELPESTQRYLYLDVAQHGLGSQACGPDVWPDETLRPRAGSIRVVIAPGG